MAGTPERAFIAAPIASAGGRIIASPFQFYTSGEDNLRVVSVNSLAGVRLKVQARFLDNAQQIRAYAWDHTPNSDRSVASDDFPLGIGAVLNLTVFASAGTPNVGQTFVIVQLVRGLGAAAIVLGTLLQGYVTSRQAVGWPGSPIVSSTSGEPFVTTLEPAAPAIGAEIVQQVPTGARWELLSLYGLLTSNAVAGTRDPRLRITTPASTNVAHLVGLQEQVASQTWEYTWAQGVATFFETPGNIATIALPSNYILTAGQIIRTLTSSLSAGDQWSQTRFVVREWLEVP